MGIFSKFGFGLKKTREGMTERIEDVLGAYEAMNLSAIAGRRVLLLDDIITTGATASECARILLTAGAKEVHCGCVAAAHHGK